jgi:flagellar motor switch protein FliG
MKNNNSNSELSKKLVQESMDKISFEIKHLLIAYVQTLYHRTWASILSFLGKDSLEAQEALRDSCPVSKTVAWGMIDEIPKTSPEVKCFVECILSFFKMDFATEFNTIKENLLNIDPDEAKKMIETFRTEIPVLQKQLDDCIFSFNDLQNLNDRAIQILLKELDQQQLAKALKGTTTEVQDHIFRNMSKTTANMLKEDLQFIGPLSLSEVDEAKSFILKTLFDLEKNGKLKINSLQPSELIK